MSGDTQKRVPVWLVGLVVGVFGLFMCAVLVVMLVLPRFNAGQAEALPTRVESVAVTTARPTAVSLPDGYLPFGDRSFSLHSDLEALVREVAGPVMREDMLDIGTWDNAPAHAYYVDLVVTDRNKRTRAELLELAYVLLREMYYNYSGPLDSVSLTLRAYSADERGHCALSVGVGKEAAHTYLPEEKPQDLESWFAALKRSAVYSDQGESEWELAYGNDPDVPVCDLANWKTRAAPAVAAAATRSPATPTRPAPPTCEEQAGAFTRQIQPIVEDFKDQLLIASSTPRIALSSEIRLLQQLHRDYQAVEVSNCFAYSAALIDLGMHSIVEGFLEFAEDSDGELAAGFMFESGAESLAMGLDQLRALYLGQPTPVYDPIAAMEARQAEVDEALGFGPTPQPAPAGTMIKVQTGLEEWLVGVERIEYAQEFSDGLGDMRRERAAGRFAVLFLNVTNLGTSSSYFFPFAAIELHDTAGNVYEVADMATIYAERYYGIVDSNFLHEIIHPGESGRVVAVFDIPHGGGPYMLANLWSPIDDPARLWVNIE